MIRIHNIVAACLTAAALFAATAACAAEPADAKRNNDNTAAGKSKSALCQGCHGEFGLSLDELIPNLAGQYASYIAKQLRNFQSGVRTHQIMSELALTVTDAELADIGAYFAGQKKMQGNGKGDNPIGRNLFLKGDAARDIQPCVSCHGENGKGKSPDIETFPVIGGQHKAYLRAQLVSWRKGERTNSPDGVMNKIAKALTDKEIEALTDYISGL